MKLVKLTDAYIKDLIREVVSTSMNSEGVVEHDLLTHHADNLYLDVCKRVWLEAARFSEDEVCYLQSDFLPVLKKDQPTYNDYVERIKNELGEYAEHWDHEEAPHSYGLFDAEIRYNQENVLLTALDAIADGGQLGEDLEDLFVKFRQVFSESILKSIERVKNVTALCNFITTCKTNKDLVTHVPALTEMVESMTETWLDEIKYRRSAENLRKANEAAELMDWLES